MFVIGCNTEFPLDFKYTNMVLHFGIVRILFECRHVIYLFEFEFEYSNVQYLIENFAAMHIDIAGT